MNIVAIIATVIGSVVSGATLFFIQRNFKRRDDREELRDRLKARESVLILKSIHANGRLTQATATAIKQGRANGEITAALADFEKADAELYDYLLEQNANKK